MLEQRLKIIEQCDDGVIVEPPKMQCSTCNGRCGFALLGSMAPKRCFFIAQTYVHKLEGGHCIIRLNEGLFLKSCAYLYGLPLALFVGLVTFSQYMGVHEVVSALLGLMGFVGMYIYSKEILQHRG